MEILVFSDSHGKTYPMRRALALHPEAKYIFFCGDGLRDFFAVAEDAPHLIACAVRGNCDPYDPLLDSPEVRLLTVQGIKICMMHGHTFGVKGGYGAAVSYACREGADVLLFGHTHIPCQTYDSALPRPLHILNPGSIGYRGDGFYSYGIIEIQAGSVLLSVGKING